jgi:hypothetical protein
MTEISAVFRQFVNRASTAEYIILSPTIGFSVGFPMYSITGVAYFTNAYAALVLLIGMNISAYGYDLA